METLRRWWRMFKIAFGLAVLIGVIIVVVNVYRDLAAAIGPHGALVVLIGVPVLLLVVIGVLVIHFGRKYDGRVR